MNKGTDHNIMTQLGITSNEYNLVTVLYYVSQVELLVIFLANHQWTRSRTLCWKRRPIYC